MSDKIAIAHKHYPVRGGAEMVADELARTFDAPVITSYDLGHSAEDVRTEEFVTNKWLRKAIAEAEYPYQHLVRDLYHVFGWAHRPCLAEYDTIVQSGNAPCWYAPEDTQTIVRYTHSTPRTPYDLHQSRDGWIHRLYGFVTRVTIEHTTSWAHRWAANSDLVAKRLQQNWGIPEERIDVVYPPVDVSNYRASAGDDGYYLFLSRLAHHKGIDIAIDAFRDLDAELVIAGDGPQRDALEEQASDLDNVRFEGYVSETRKQELFANARASLFLADNEDFGIVPIESLAAGTPVIGVDDGFTRHQITHGETGLLVNRTADGVRGAVWLLESDGVTATAEDMHAFAQRFNRDRFRREMHAVVEKAQEDSRIKAPWEEPDAAPPETVETLASAMTDGGAADE